jgi:protein-tyrosine-phosphatase
MNILFICNGNSARSQEAEAFLRRLRPDLAIKSVGVNITPGKPIDPKVVQIMREVDIDMADVARKSLSPADVGWQDKIISFVEPSDLPDYAKQDLIDFWPIVDPRGESIEFHRDVRDQIKTKVETLAEAAS